MIISKVWHTCNNIQVLIPWKSSYWIARWIRVAFTTFHIPVPVILKSCSALATALFFWGGMICYPRSIRPHRTYYANQRIRTEVSGNHRLFFSSFRQQPLPATHCWDGRKLEFVILGICWDANPECRYRRNFVPGIPRQDLWTRGHWNLSGHCRDQMHRNYHRDQHMDTRLSYYHPHRIRFTGDNRISAMAGNATQHPVVMSSHHQAIQLLSSGWEILATSMDGQVIEAIGHQRYPHVLGVQFHPELREITSPDP